MLSSEGTNFTVYPCQLKDKINPIISKEIYKGPGKLPLKELPGLRSLAQFYHGRVEFYGQPRTPQQNRVSLRLARAAKEQSQWPIWRRAKTCALPGPFSTPSNFSESNSLPSRKSKESNPLGPVYPSWVKDNLSP